MPHNHQGISTIAKHARESGEPPELSGEEQLALDQSRAGARVADQKALQRAKWKLRVAEKLAGQSGIQKRKNDRRETNRGLRQLHSIPVLGKFLAMIRDSPASAKHVLEAIRRKLSSVV